MGDGVFFMQTKGTEFCGGEDGLWTTDFFNECRNKDDEEGDASSASHVRNEVFRKVFDGKVIVGHGGG